MFQYSFGRALSLRNRADLELDAITLFQSDHRYRRVFALDLFSIPKDVRVKHYQSRMDALRLKAAKIMSKYRPLENRNFIEENSDDQGRFQHKYANWQMKRPTFFSGYWQSPYYFNDYTVILKEDLSFRKECTSPVRNWLQEIRKKPSAAIHVRRQDFWSTLDISYYRKAIKYLRGVCGELELYLFTDYPGWWPIQDAEIGKVRVVAGNDLSDADTFQIMCACDHFVIANSSYSWWAAWLGKNCFKQVVAPSQDIWFKANDILLSNWIIIPVEKDYASKRDRVTSFNFVASV